MEKNRIHPQHLVLALIGYSPGQRIEGRTFLQKLAYFVNDKIGLGVSFKPYYYGPYSEEIAAATQSLVASGFLDETEDLFPLASSDIFERRRYSYRLTQDGKKVLAQLEGEFTILQDVKEVTQRVMGAEQCDYECLSIAAKTHHILRAKGGPMKGSEIMRVAHELGWNIADNDLQRAADFLKQLGLVKEVE